MALDDLDHPDALAVLAKAPTPEQGKALSATQIVAALRRGGRKRNIDRRATEIRDALRLPQLAAAPLLTDAFGVSVAALVPVIASIGKQITLVEARLIERFEAHPDAELLLSLPGLGHVLGAWVLAELGDAPSRYGDARARRNYAGAPPVTRQSGTSKIVSARLARNSRLFDALWQWAFCALSASPGARAYYDAHNPGPHTSKTARRKLANKLVGILHGCLTHRTAYDEQLAWANWTDQDDLAA